MKNIIWIIIFILSSCSRIQTLNLEKHQYSKRPNHIIWIQLAGFSESHLSLLKFNNLDTSNRLSLEEMDCSGHLWAYNLYSLRPKADFSFRSQLTGSKNIKGSCEDFTENVIWRKFLDQDYKVSILELGTNKESSLENMYSCENGARLLESLRYYKMGKFNISEQGDLGFHYQESKTSKDNFLKAGRFFDKSCSDGICYSTLFNNFKTIWTDTAKDNKTFTVIYDFNFYNSLKKKDLSQMKEDLLEVEKIAAYLKSLDDNDILLLITGSESQPIEFPKEGKEWAQYEKNGLFLSFKNSDLMSPVFAKGAMAENFCGIFDEAEMNFRLRYKPEAKKFDWDLINPL